MRVDPVLLSPSQLATLAPTRFANVVQLSETTSTNSVLLAEAAHGAPDGLVVVSDYQAQGRGRFERRWESPAGKSLLFSVLLRPSLDDLPLDRRHLAVCAVSLALVDGARSATQVRLRLKWPNDLIAVVPGQPDRKVAGILAEGAGGRGGAEPVIVVGAGLNVGWSPEGQVSTCLEALAGHPVDRGEVLVQSLLALEHLYGHWDEIARRYRESCATLGREVVVTFAGASGPGTGLPTGSPPPGGLASPPGGLAPPPVTDVRVLRGTAIDMDEDGHLLVRTRRGEVERVAAGDVSHTSPAPRSSLGGQ